MEILKKYISYAKNADDELIRFGLHQFLFSITNFIIIILIGILNNRIMEALIFLISYPAIRSYAGGYHAKSISSCYFLSTLIIFVIFSSFNISIWSQKSFLLFSTLLSFLIIWKCAPIDSENRRLYMREIYILKKIVRAILVFEVLILLLSILYKIQFVVNAIAASLDLTTILMILGYHQYRRNLLVCKKL